MMRTTTIVFALAVGAAACSKDETDRAARATANKAVEPARGVAVVSANELGPQPRKTVSITTRSDDARSAFERGRRLQENVRVTEAVVEFRRAVEMDPSFALAHAYLSVTSENRTEKSSHMDRALELSGDLPEAEQLLVKGLAARARGDIAGEREVYQRLREVASDDYRVAMFMGMSARRLGDVSGAIEALERAIELDPKAAEPYNDLAYARLAAGELDKAVESAQTYARLRPKEPNPQDSLGEILLSAGRFAQAEAAFRKALEIEPSFTVAYEGVSLAAAYQQRWDRAVALMREAIAAEAAPPMKLRFLENLIWLELGAAESKAALATVGELEEYAANECKDCIKGGYLLRPAVLHAAGEYARAHRVLARKLASIEGEGERADGDRFWLLVADAWSSVEGGKLGAARKVLHKLEAIARKAGDAKRFASGLKFVRGSIALAGGDSASAAELLGGVGEGAPYFVQARWQLAAALEAQGNTAAADKLRATITSSYLRDFQRAYYWQHYSTARGS